MFPKCLAGFVEMSEAERVVKSDPRENTTMKRIVIDYLAEELKSTEPVVDFLAEELKREDKQQRTGLKAMGKAAGAGR
jgi:hypothetical protein